MVDADGSHDALPATPAGGSPGASPVGPRGGPHDASPATPAGGSPGASPVGPPDAPCDASPATPAVATQGATPAAPDGASHDPSTDLRQDAKTTAQPSALLAIREAVLSDVPRLVELVRELAEYERAVHEVEATEEHFRAALFPEDPSAARSHALVAEAQTPEGPLVVGMAVWYVTFSTWLGRHGIWLEDLYVSPDRRGGGLGKALLTRLAQIAVERAYGRVEWWVLDWNTPSIDFYRSLGAQPQDGWTVYRLDGMALTSLGAP